MRLNSRAAREALARKACNVPELAKMYGCTDQRMRIILNSVELSEKTMGKLAKALDIDVKEIILQ